MENTTPGTALPNVGSSIHGEGGLTKASSMAHGAIDSISVKADDAASKTKPAIDRVASVAHQAVDKAAGAAAPTADWLNEQGESLKVAQKKLVEDTCSYVSAHPVKAIGIALAAGFFISRLLR